MCRPLKTYQISYTEEQAKEMPMIDIAFEILKTTEPSETPFVFRDLMQEVVRVKKLELDQDQLLKLTAQLFTDMNIDGRFASTRNRTWGLKSWQTLNKDEILNIDDGNDEDEELAEFDEDDISTEKHEISAIGDEVIAKNTTETNDYEVVGDPYSDEDDLDNKSLDDELPEIEGLPDLEGDLSLEDMKLEEEQDDADDFDDSDDDV